jgi:hypothetical protein
MITRLDLLRAAIAPLFVLTACSGRDAGTAPATSATDAAAAAAASTGTTAATSGITGTVGTLSGSCPVLTFKLEGKTIKTSAATRFDGGACADVKNGSRANVTGPTQSDGSVLAEKVSLLAATTTTVAPPTAITVTGTVGALAGACPTISFTLEGKTARTSSATVYTGGACGDVKNGSRLTISGTTQTDQSVAVEKVTVLPPTTTTTPSTTLTITGTINSIAGTCPSVTFVLEAKKIVISAATTYERGTCTDLKNAIKVTATGAVQSDGSVAATRVAFQ